MGAKSEIQQKAFAKYLNASDELWSKRNAQQLPKLCNFFRVKFHHIIEP